MSVERECVVGSDASGREIRFDHDNLSLLPELPHEAGRRSPVSGFLVFVDLR